MSIISLREVSKTFSRGKPNEFQALDNFNMDVDSGVATVVAGPSGSGKTTLLSLLGLMSRPSSGRITVLGKETTLLGENLRTSFRRKHVGFVFQHFHLITYLRVDENLDLALYPEGLPLKRIRRRRAELLERFGLEAKARSRVSVLSGGEKQRLAIARALMNSPEILLIDEPTAHLDTRLSRQVITLFEELKRDGKTIIIASHDPLILESGLSERVLHIRDGRVTGEA
ncbi:ABC transporter ATP-binding protein [Thermodesulfobacteriota bacterium]